MATLRSLNITRMRDLVTCSVCLELLEDPKALPCLHSFCTQCLEDMRGHTLPATITCPVCKDVTKLPGGGIQGLPSDFKVEQMKDIMEMGEGGVSGPWSGCLQCDVCRDTADRRPARLHCPQCAVFYCERCIRKHAANALFRKHEVTKLTSGGALAAGTASLSFCQRHVGHRVLYVCVTCQPYVAICSICYLDHDITHDVSELKDVAENFRNQFQADLNGIKAKIEALKKQKEGALERRGAHEQMLQDVQEAICWQTLLIIAQVEDAKAKMVTEAQDMFAALCSSFDEDDVDSTLKDLNEVESHLELIVNGPTEACLAFHENLGLTERVEKLQNLAIPEESLNKSVQFVPNKENITQDILGTLEYFFKSDANHHNNDRRDSIIKTERLEMVTTLPEMVKQKITIPKKNRGRTIEDENKKGCDERCGSQCESCKKKSVLISFYSKKLDRLQKLCRHCRALTDRPTRCTRQQRLSGKGEILDESVLTFFG